MSQNLEYLNDLLKAESPTYSPRYIGHMVSEISLPAILGHFSALLHNPNNTSADASLVGGALEMEAIEMLMNWSAMIHQRETVTDTILFLAALTK